MVSQRIDRSNRRFAEGGPRATDGLATSKKRRPLRQRLEPNSRPALAHGPQCGMGSLMGFRSPQLCDFVINPCLTPIFCTEIALSAGTFFRSLDYLGNKAVRSSCANGLIGTDQPFVGIRGIGKPCGSTLISLGKFTHLPPRQGGVENRISHGRRPLRSVP